MKHLLGRGDWLTECYLTAARPDELTAELDECTCRACKTSLIHQGMCPACGEKTLTWSPHPKKLTSVADGRLTARDIETIFYLACDYCSETVIPEVSPAEVAEALTAMKWTPR